MMILNSLAVLLIAASLIPVDALPGARMRQRQTNNDQSRRSYVPAPKYFHESSFDSHYDGRYTSSAVPEHDRVKHLAHLTRTYLSTMADIGAETWIMHGSLLGWWWNRRTMPWDSDLDVQMSERSMAYLAKFYNMSIHHYDLPDVPEGRDYLLEINPQWVNDSIHDIFNVIDARWIDTVTGLFVDITTLRPDPDREAQGVKGALMCKDRHQYLAREMFPLRDSVFDDTPVKVPFAYSELLQQEYGPASVASINFKDHGFDEEEGVWTSTIDAVQVVKNAVNKDRDGDGAPG